MIQRRHLANSKCIFESAAALGAIGVFALHPYYHNPSCRLCASDAVFVALNPEATSFRPIAMKEHRL